MRQPGDEIARQFGSSGKQSSNGSSAFHTLRTLIERSPKQSGYTDGDSSSLPELELLEHELHMMPARQSQVAARLRESLGRINGSSREASSDLRSLLEDVTGSRVHLTLEDVVAKVASIRWRVANSR